MKSSMRYHLTREECQKSTNEFFTKLGCDATSDKTGDGERQLLKDFKRNTKIADVSSKKGMTDDEAKQEMDSALEKISPESRASFRKNYSQFPQMMLSGPVMKSIFGFVESAMDSTLVPSSPESVDVDLFEENKKGYYKARLESIPIKTPEDETINMPGPVEVLFKAKNNLFELQSISTDSKIMRDMIMGEFPKRTDIDAPADLSKFFLDVVSDPNIYEIYCKRRACEQYLSHLKKEIDGKPGVTQPDFMDGRALASDHCDRLVKQAVYKHNHIKALLAILDNQELQSYHKLEAFNQKLKTAETRGALTRRRDSHLTTFLKAVGVGAAAFFTAGVMYKKARDTLFGDKATRGGRLMSALEAKEPQQNQSVQRGLRR